MHKIALIRAGHVEQSLGSLGDEAVGIIIPPPLTLLLAVIPANYAAFGRNANQQRILECDDVCDAIFIWHLLHLLANADLNCLPFSNVVPNQPSPRVSGGGFNTWW